MQKSSDSCSKKADRDEERDGERAERALLGRFGKRRVLVGRWRD